MNYSRNHKTIKEWELAKTIVYNLSLSLFFTLLLVVVSMKVFGFRLDEVLSDSMAPVFTRQDIIVVVPQDSYKIGDIVEYRGTLGGKPANVTHRVIAYDKATDTYTFQGETNSGIELVAGKNCVGKQVAIWHNGRFVYGMFNNNFELILTMVIAAWGLSTILANEKEIARHDITRD